LIFHSDDVCQVNFGVTRELNPDPLARRYPVTISPFAARFVTILPFGRSAL
jgi:hypothetical protein